MCHKTFVLRHILLASAGRWPAPPFGISNARRKRTLPLPRSCLRQKRHPPAPLLLHALPRPGPWQTQFEDPLLRSLANEKDLLRSLRAVTSQCRYLALRGGRCAVRGGTFGHPRQCHRLPDADAVGRKANGTIQDPQILDGPVCCRGDIVPQPSGPESAR